MPPTSPGFEVRPDEIRTRSKRVSGTPRLLDDGNFERVGKAHREENGETIWQPKAPGSTSPSGLR